MQHGNEHGSQSAKQELTQANPDTQNGGGNKQGVGHDGFEIRIDGEEFKVTTKTMTAAEILQLANLALADHYLTEIHGGATKSYQGKPEQVIHLHPGSRFSSVFTGPTTVSDSGSALQGAALFAQQLRLLGYEVTELEDGHITFPYTVEEGKYAGRAVTHGLVIPPDFPLTPPTGPHVTPPLHPIMAGGVHPLGGIHASANHSRHFKEGWQYWSRRYPSWAQSRKNAAAYLSFLRGLWRTQ